VSTRGARTDRLLGSDDLVSVLVEALVRSLWLIIMVVVSLVRLALRVPVLAASIGLAATLWLWHGSSGAALAVLVTVAALGVWFVIHRSSWYRMFLEPVMGMPRTVLYRLRWARVARRVGLQVRHFDLDADSREARTPRLVRMRVMRSGLDRLLLRLPVGMVPGEVEDAADALAHAYGCLAARVTPDRPGRLWIELVRRDPLATTVTVMNSLGAQDLAAVPVGRREDGSTWSLRLAGTHLLIAGATGAGKSSVLWSLLRALQPDIGTGRVQVWAVDPKGGMELRPGRSLFARFEDTSPEDMCTLLEDLVSVKDERAKDLAASGDRVHFPHPRSPHIVAILDELATLTAFADRSVTRRIDTALGLLLTQGRACGITVVAAMQDPGKDIVGWRDLFPTRIAMRLDNPIQVAMVLGEGAREMGARADEISELTPGVAYVRVEGTRTIQRVRAAYLSDTDIHELARPPLAGAIRCEASWPPTEAPISSPIITGGESR
jgi:S-DNA-T family DNA segregation ATPase FtsK/SpoIIIE